MTQLPTLCNVQYDMYPGSYGMEESVSQWNNSLTMPVRTTVGCGTWLHPCYLASSAASTGNSAKNRKSCKFAPEHRAATSLSRYQAASTEMPAFESSQQPYRSSQRVTFQQDTLFESDHCQVRAHTTLGARHDIAKESCSRLSFLEKKSDRRLLASRQRTLDPLQMQREAANSLDSDVKYQKDEEKVIWVDDLRRWISNERPGESSFISFVNTVHMNGRMQNKSDNEDNDYLQHFKLNSKTLPKQMTKKSNRLLAPRLLTAPMKNASAPIIKRLFDARLSAENAIKFEEKAAVVDVDLAKELETPPQIEENDEDELQSNIETELNSEIDREDEAEIEADFEAEAETNFEVEVEAGIETTTTTTDLIETNILNLDLETEFLEIESESESQLAKSEESSDYERMNSPDNNAQIYARKPPPSLPSPPPPLLSPTLNSSLQEDQKKEARRQPPKKVRIENNATVHEFAKESLIIQAHGSSKVKNQANWIFFDSFENEDVEKDKEPPVKQKESPSELEVILLSAATTDVESELEENNPEESDSRFLELKPRIARQAGKPRWSSKKRDRSLAEEMERERLAEERRKRSEERLARLRQKFIQGGIKGSRNDDLRYEEYGFLAKYCILNRKSIGMYKAAFDAVDEKRRGWLTPEETLIALRGVNSKLTDAEKKYLSRVLELCGYSMHQGSNFKLFSVIAALSQRITSLDLWMKNLIGQMDFKMLDMKFFMCKQLWEFNVDCVSNQIPVDQLCIELRAGGVTDAHIREVRQRFGQQHALDLMDFLTYIPLFITLHCSIVANPLDMQQTL